MWSAITYLPHRMPSSGKTTPWKAQKRLHPEEIEDSCEFLSLPSDLTVCVCVMRWKQSPSNDDMSCLTYYTPLPSRGNNGDDRRWRRRCRCRMTKRRRTTHRFLIKMKSTDKPSTVSRALWWDESILTKDDRHWNLAVVVFAVFFSVWLINECG